ncbi:MAG TPA: hypothetical protein VIQ74_02160 [Gemmatimonadaceae bacterium]|jgi:hypothetical protein
MFNANTYPTPRRGFLARLGAASVAFGLGGAIPSPLRAEPADAMDGIGDHNSEDWLSGVKGKHRQVLDAVSINDGFSLVWSMVFLNTHNEASKLPDRELSAVTVLRHSAIPIGFTDSIWAKYKLGEAFDIKDSATKAPALRNPYYHPREGELMFPGMSVDALLARGVIFGVCSLATKVFSGIRAKAVGVPEDEALEEWKASLIPGMTFVPSGIWAVNHAQEHRCSYCYAG